MDKRLRNLTEDLYNMHMQQLKEVDIEDYNWLSRVPKSQWTRHIFSPNPKFDLLCNNMCDSFNQFVKQARDKPILTLLEVVSVNQYC